MRFFRKKKEENKKVEEEIELTSIEQLNLKIEQFGLLTDRDVEPNLKFVSDREKYAWEKAKQYGVTEKYFLIDMLKAGLYDDNFSHKEIKLERLKQLEDAFKDACKLRYNAEYYNQLEKTAEVIRNKEKTAALETLKLAEILKKHFEIIEYMLDVTFTLIVLEFNDDEKIPLKAVSKIVADDSIYNNWSRIVYNPIY